ncbi:phospholipase C [Ranunculus cassubicifolius]
MHSSLIQERNGWWKGPVLISEFQHFSYLPPIKDVQSVFKIFGLLRLLERTFEDMVLELSVPRTDCPEVLPDVVSLRIHKLMINHELMEKTLG